MAKPTQAKKGVLRDKERIRVYAKKFESALAIAGEDAAKTLKNVPDERFANEAGNCPGRIGDSNESRTGGQPDFR